MDQAKSYIKLAVLDCAQQCLGADDAIECAKEYGANLLDSGAWELGDIEVVVESALEVVAILNAMDQ